MDEEGWDFAKIQDVIPEYVIELVRSNLRYVRYENKEDRPWWIRSSREFHYKKCLGDVKSKIRCQ